MKIAIPTDDGIKFPALIKNPKAFLVITIESGEIINEELRWNKLFNAHPGVDSILTNLSDCSIFIINKNSDFSHEILPSESLEVITSKEEIITNVIMEFLHTTLQEESNTCCSP